MSEGDMNDGPVPPSPASEGPGSFPRVPDPAPAAYPAAPNSYPVPAPATEPTPASGAETWPQRPEQGPPTLPAYGTPPPGYGTPGGGYAAPPAGYNPLPPGYGAWGSGWEQPTAAPGGYGAPPPPGYGAVPPGYGATYPGYGAAGTPGGSPAPARRHGLLLAFGAFLLLVAAVAGVAIGHAVWSGGSTSAAPASGSGGSQLPSGGNSGGGSGSGSSGGPSSSAAGGPTDAASIASGVDPGLVDIDTTLGYQGAEAAGTGQVLTSSGEVLTNNHVIDGATTINATDLGNGRTYSATVVGYDRTKDIAVLQLRGASGLKTVSIGDSSDAKVGTQVVGIGNAGGSGGTPSSAGGSVTALNQSITASDEGDGTSEQLSGLIQTNADIQPGDSGGPLVSTSGKVLGIDTAASSGTTFQTPNGSAANEGFAIPINGAVSIAQQIAAGNAASGIYIGRTAFLGVLVTANSGGSSGSGGSAGSGGSGSGGFGGFTFGGPGSSGSGSGGSGTSTSGAEVAQVLSGSPAENAGLSAGDVITGFGSRSVTSPQQLTQDVMLYHPGDHVTVQWTNANGQQQTGTITLASGPPQ